MLRCNAVSSGLCLIVWLDLGCWLGGVYVCLMLALDFVGFDIGCDGLICCDCCFVGGGVVRLAGCWAVVLLFALICGIWLVCDGACG